MAEDQNAQHAEQGGFNNVTKQSSRKMEGK